MKLIPTLALCALAIQHATPSSIKMDFLPFANVRTDPIVAPNSLSHHVHTFYGATVARPETTYQDLRNAYGGTGSAEQNMSLYWHPTIYKVQPDGTKKMVNMYFASAYYIWTPGEATAFPNGFKMIAFVPESQAVDWFPQEPTEELETEMVFPDCWDGVNIDSEDHMSHVAYSAPGEDVSQPCPPSHPVRVPKISFFVRIYNYEGGPHIFSDGTTRMHADYMSGWDANELQRVLDNCVNPSFESAPDQFCEDFLTYKDVDANGAKSVDPCGSLESELSKIQAFQPPPLDSTTITEEVIDNVKDLPIGQGVGVLKMGPTGTLGPAPTVAPVTTGCSGDDGGGGGGEDEDGEGGEEGDDEGEEEGETGDGDGDEGEGDGEGNEDDESGDEEDDEEGVGDGDCFDDEEFMFFVNSRLGERSCGWLSLRPIHAMRLCDEDEEIADNCLATCGNC